MSEVDKLPPLVPRWLSIFRALKFVNNPIPILSDNLEKYGSTYAFHIGGLKKGMVTSDAKVIQHVLQKNHKNYRKSDIQRNILARYVGQGLLTAEGHFWLRQRRLIQPGFHRERLNNLSKLMHEEIINYCNDLIKKAEKSPIVDVHREMHRLTFRIVAKTLFSVGIEEEVLTNLRSQITQLQAFIIKLVRQPYARWWFKLSGAIRQHDLIAMETRNIIRQIIRTRINAKDQEDDLLQMLIDSRYEDSGKPMTEEQILDECLIIFVAGHETSANALTWALHLLSNAPKEQTCLLQELLAIDQFESLSFKNLNGLSYTRQIIEEAMRLYPPAWVLDRVALEDDSVSGYLIPKGTTIFLYVFGTHHQAAYWKNPSAFQPERFGHDVGTKKYQYLPFGGGPRLCIGNNFAMMEMQLILGHLFRNFRFNGLKKKVEMEPLITLRPKGGVQMQITKRGELAGHF